MAEAPPYLVGALFGLAFLVLARAGGMRVSVPAPSAWLIGLAGSVVLVVLAIGASSLAGQPLRAVPKTDFALWAVITIVVASAEELVLRGALFNALRDSSGPGRRRRRHERRVRPDARAPLRLARRPGMPRSG